MRLSSRPSPFNYRRTATNCIPCNAIRADFQSPEPLPPNSQAESTLTLETLEGLALANNPALAKAEAQVRAIRGKWLQSGLYPNPVLGYSGDEMGDSGTAGKQGAFVTQEIVTAGKLGA